MSAPSPSRSAIELVFVIRSPRFETEEPAESWSERSSDTDGSATILVASRPAPTMSTSFEAVTFSLMNSPGPIRTMSGVASSFAAVTAVFRLAAPRPPGGHDGSATQ